MLWLIDFVRMKIYDPNPNLSGNLTGQWKFTNASGAVNAPSADGAATTELAAGYFVRVSDGQQWYDVTAITDDDNFTVAPVFAQTTETDSSGLTRYAQELTFEDEQLQKLLDANKKLIRREKLDGDVKVYLGRYGFLEGVVDDDAGSWSGDPTIALWESRLEDSTEYTPDSWNLVDGTFTFDADQDEVLYLDAKAYDIEGVIADCLEQKAMDPNMTSYMARGGVVMARYNLVQMAAFHRRRSWAKTANINRKY